MTILIATRGEACPKGPCDRQVWWCDGSMPRSGARLAVSDAGRASAGTDSVRSRTGGIRSGTESLIRCVRGWRIFGPGVSGKRTVSQGQSSLIKPNQSKMASWMSLRAGLGHEVGEFAGRVSMGVAARSIWVNPAQSDWRESGEVRRAAMAGGQKAAVVGAGREALVASRSPVSSYGGIRGRSVTRLPYTRAQNMLSQACKAPVAAQFH